jgi:hypothetical protein
VAVVELVGERAQGVLGGPAGPQPGHQPGHLGGDRGRSGAQRRDQSLLQADADREHSGERAGPFLHRFEARDPLGGRGGGEQHGQADEGNGDDDEGEHPSGHQECDDAGGDAAEQEAPGLSW